MATIYYNEDNSTDLYLYGQPEDDSRYKKKLDLKDQEHIKIDSIYLYGILLISKDELAMKGHFYADEIIKIFSNITLTELFDACRLSK